MSDYEQLMIGLGMIVVAAPLVLLVLLGLSSLPGGGLGGDRFIS